MSPQLEQGANMALLDAYALSRALEISADLDAAMAAYASMRQSRVRLYQATSRLFTSACQSDSKLPPWLRDGVAGPLSRIWPGPYMPASMVAGTLGRPLQRLGLDFL